MTATIFGWVLATVAWAGFAGVQSARIEKLNKENRLLKSENTRLEKATRKEPSVVEALAVLQAKCRRTRYAQKCPDECERCLRLYCSESTTLPCNIADSVLNYQDGAEISKAIEQKTNEYREGNKS